MATAPPATRMPQEPRRQDTGGREPSTPFPRAEGAYRSGRNAHPEAAVRRQSKAHRERIFFVDDELVGAGQERRRRDLGPDAHAVGPDRDVGNRLASKRAPQAA